MMDADTLRRRLDEQDWRCCYPCDRGRRGGTISPGERVAIAFDGHGIAHAECSAQPALIAPSRRASEPSRPLPAFRALSVRDVMTEIPVALISPHATAGTRDEAGMRRAGYSTDGAYAQLIIVDLLSGRATHDPIEWRSAGNTTLFAAHYAMTRYADGLVVLRDALLGDIDTIDAREWREQLIDEGVIA